MKKILIIEDNQIVANVYRNKLVVEGYQAEAALDAIPGVIECGVFARRTADVILVGRAGGGVGRIIPHRYDEA